MDSLQYQYIRNNKYFLCSIGLWPFQSLLEKILIRTAVIPFVFGQAFLQAAGLTTAAMAGDVDDAVENLTPGLISTMCLCKFINFLYNQKKMKNLINLMKDDWNVHREFKSECEVLCRHYAVAKKMTTVYAVCLYTSMTPFMVMPSLLNIADALGYYNLSNQRQLMFPLDHLLNTEKYYHLLLIHSYFGTMLFITMVVAVDMMIVIYIQHECGLCEILGQRLQRIVENDSLNVDLYPRNRNDRPYQNVRSCIMLHKHIISLARTIEDANTTSYFFQLGFNMFGVSLTQYEAAVNLNRPSTSLRFGSFTICLLSILLLQSWPGQQLSDYSERISEYTTNGKWYQSSMRTRKLLSIMLSKSGVPLKLTALKFYTLNIENFSSVVRTSFSYCMVLCSLQ